MNMVFMGRIWHTFGKDVAQPVARFRETKSSGAIFEDPMLRQGDRDTYAVERRRETVCVRCVKQSVMKRMKRMPLLLFERGPRM